MRLALFEPDIPQNTGTIMRLAACLGVPLDVIEPCGFPLADRRLRRGALDYIAHLDWERHRSWTAYLAWRAARPAPGRLVLLTTRASDSHLDFAFRPDDTLLLGRESLGVPQSVHAQADARIVIPMREGLRSLNVALAAAVVLGEALRQTGLFPGPP